MAFYGARRIVILGPVFTILLAFASPAFSQQVTYYDFDAPQASNDASYACVDPAHTVPVTPNPLFCFNDGTGRRSSPRFLSDIYPAKIDPVTTDNPPVQSTHYAVQNTPPALSQSASMWFSVPQKVSNGFTSYFAFKITPNANSFATADGIAFVIQNSQNAAGGSSSGSSACSGAGSGPNTVGAAGGCIGYGGIDNSLAIELDTFRNGWDPADNVSSNANNDNHIAVQNCGAGQPNSPDHTGSCLVSFNSGNAAQPALNNLLPVSLADGNVHEVVIVYSGPTEAVPNLLQIFIDPVFVAGTHTPAPGATPVLSGTYNISSNLNLMNSGSTNDSAYVGFTSATGAAFEQHELMAWTFTPHTPSTQQQPLNPPGQPTTFPFGSHVYTVTYPANGPSTANIDMIVTANTITPTFFASLIAGGPFVGSQCQVYDETGGNCIVYSVSCVTHGTSTVVPCPATTDPDNPISIKSAYNNSVQPVSPGFLQGDPLFSQIATITGDGQTATVSCTGECSVVQGQTVTVAGSVSDGGGSSPFNGTVTVLTENPNAPNTFTFSSTVSGNASGGYLTSNNVQNVFTAYVPQRIDGTTTGKTKNFSDLVVTSVTAAPTTLVIEAPSVPYNQSALITVTASSPNGTPTGNISLTVDNGAPQTQALSNGSATFTLTGLGAGPHQLTVTYASQSIFLGASTTGSFTINPATPTVMFTGAPATAAFNSSFVVAASTNASTTATMTVAGSCVILGNTVTMTSGTGSCNLTAAWPADSNYLAASATQSTLAIKATSTTTIVADTPNPSSVGTPVSISFTVMGNGKPTGNYTVASSISGDPGCNGILSAGVGSCSLTFAASGSRTITITYTGDGNFSGSSTNVQQSVTAGPVAQLSASNLNFGTVYVGTISTQTITLTNIGTAVMTVNGPILSDVGGRNSIEFVALNLCPRSLAIGKSCNIYISFVAGPIYKPQTAVLKVMDNAAGAPQLVTLSATTINPRANFKPSSLNFGTQSVGIYSQASLQLINTGATPLLINNIGVAGANAGDFSSTNTCPPSLAAGSSCTITVGFRPGNIGSRTAYIKVTDNAQGGPQQVPLSGKGK
jgi:Bacterial lectin/Bacterial Ig-like domain (group 3)/Abnormal spindle-like microcephaly-assoc'd, ASPM-SPD-2-Hydin